MIAVRNLTYTYPDAAEPALRGIDWDVPAGKFVLVAGPSGSGKSTLLRCLNGLVPHFSGGVLSGSLTVGGVDPIAAGPRLLSRHVGLVAQNPEAQAVLDEVEGEIAFALENAAVPPPEMRHRIEEVLDLLALTQLRARALHTLSGGERQRLAIASALALRPHTLVLDEPTSQLDPQSADDVLRALVRLNEELGITVVLAEHRLERIARYAHRLTWLEHGRVAADGPVRETLSLIEGGPPLVQLGRVLGWRPLPLTTSEARPFAVQTLESVSNARIQEPSHRSPTPTPVLEVKDLHFAYNGHKALRGVDLVLHKGQALALVGRSGAGKSTLLKCLVGLLRPQSGEVLLNGRSTRGRSVADICREVAYLPQNPDDLLFADSVLDELQVTLRNHRIDPAAGEVEELLGTLGLGGLETAYPRDLSVGQRQRVALGAVTVTRPRVVLLDEPTRGLDPVLKEELVALWRRWLDDGVALLLVTHDVELAVQIAGRAVMLDEGEVAAAGETGDVLGRSDQFTPQIARLFPGSGWLTVDDVVQAVDSTNGRK